MVFTNSNCTGCNKCIKVCGVTGACIAAEVLANENSCIRVDGERCISCGACFDACEHNAREYSDDTLRFFDDLARGESISVLIAPALKANYPDACCQGKISTFIKTSKKSTPLFAMQRLFSATRN